MSGAITQAEALDRLMGGSRSEDQIAKDGAKVVISQIDKLRRQLDKAERAAQHVLRTGKEQKGEDAIWRRVRKAADNLLDGMPV